MNFVFYARLWVSGAAGVYIYIYTHLACAYCVAWCTACFPLWNGNSRKLRLSTSCEYDFYVAYTLHNIYTYEYGKKLYNMNTHINTHTTHIERTPNSIHISSNVRSTNSFAVCYREIACTSSGSDAGWRICVVATARARRRHTTLYLYTPLCSHLCYKTLLLFLFVFFS